jgi:hypothetical protein
MFILVNKEETEQFGTDSYAERYRHERRQINMIWEPNHPLTKWEKHNPYMGYTFKDATRAVNETRHVHNQGICMCKGKCGWEETWQEHVDRMQIEEDHDDHGRHGCYVPSCWEHGDAKESEWVICNRQKENNPTEESTDHVMEV